jgi:ribose 1,5-bisphosphokinase PhnN
LQAEGYQLESQLILENADPTRDLDNQREQLQNQLKRSVAISPRPMLLQIELSQRGRESRRNMRIATTDL